MTVPSVSAVLSQASLASGRMLALRRTADITSHTHTVIDCRCCWEHTGRAYTHNPPVASESEPWCVCVCVCVFLYPEALVNRSVSAQSYVPSLLRHAERHVLK